MSRDINGPVSGDALFVVTGREDIGDWAGQASLILLPFSSNSISNPNWYCICTAACTLIGSRGPTLRIPEEALPPLQVLQDPKTDIAPASKPKWWS